MDFNSRKLLTVAALITAFASSPSEADTKASNKINNSNLSLIDPSKWHGFNLLNMFWKNWKDGAFQEKDFQLVNELGFNFVRLPLDYRILTDEKDWLKLKEDRLRQVDEAVRWGSKHKVHVCLNIHRAPGYIVSDKEPETTNLWTDKNAQKAFLNLWKTFAERYKGIPATELSFNLLNEPANVESKILLNVLRPIIKSIREIDPSRTIMIDGLEWGKKPILDYEGASVIQSTRGYSPHELLSWNPQSGTPKPQWPTVKFNRQWLAKNEIAPWQILVQKGVSVFVGEFGARNTLPHSFVLAWMEDQLKIWKEAKWGWALWNLHGEHGIFDSGRTDIVYEEYRGHKLDRAMLDLLQKYK